MNTIKFNHDYQKLPLFWDGTQALLVSVTYIEDMDTFKNRYPQLIVADTKIRGEEGSYPLAFKEGLLLTYFHYNSHTLFMTIRRYTPAKAIYYDSRVMETFELMRVYE